MHACTTGTGLLTGDETGVEGLASKVLVVLLKVLLGGRGEFQGSELEAKTVLDLSIFMGNKNSQSLTHVARSEKGWGQRVHAIDNISHLKSLSQSP